MLSVGRSALKMTKHKCFAVPPYLVEAIAAHAAKTSNTQLRASYDACSSHCDMIREKRVARFDYLSLPRGARRAAARQAALEAGRPDPTDYDQPPSTKKSIVPVDLLRHISESDKVDENTRACAKRDLDHLQQLHARVETMQQGEASQARIQSIAGDEATAASGRGKQKPQKFYRAVYDAKNTSDENQLPGEIARVEGNPAVKDNAVNEAYDNCGKVLKFYKDLFNWNSIDNNNMHVVSSVHFGEQYGNAFWDPDREQMVYGDGDNFLHNFTGCIDVIGHEMTHAVTEYTSPLNYQGQPGALNEHVSDVFGIMVKQFAENEKAADADWLIGEGCLLPGIKGVALRSMKAPGTAYDDEALGKDPQPDHFKDYRPTTSDNGGVHLFSGIPNKAFYLSSVAFGGYSWEKAGKIWWETMRSGQIAPRSTFLQFADVTISKAEELFGADGKKIVKDAWAQVGVSH